MGLTNIEAMDGYMLADKLTPRQFAELAGLDYEAGRGGLRRLRRQSGDYGQLVGKLSTYQVPLLDMLLYVCDQIDAGVVTLSDDQTADPEGRPDSRCSAPRISCRARISAGCWST